MTTAGAILRDDVARVTNNGGETLLLYLPCGGTVSLAPNASYPPLPGIYWTRTSGNTWRVEIWREGT